MRLWPLLCLCAAVQALCLLGPRLVAVDAGPAALCALSEAGSLYCASASHVRGTAISPAGAAGGTALSVLSGAAGACTVDDNGSIACWAAGAASSAPPVHEAAASLDCAAWGCCATLASGRLACWEGDTAWSLSAAGAQTSFSGAVAVDDAGRICAATAAGLACGDARNGSLSLAVAGGAQPFAAVTTSGCAVWANGSVSCAHGAASWLQSMGAVASACSTDGEDGMCALLAANGSVVCDGVAVALPARATAIACSTQHSCALVGDGRAVCWPPGDEQNATQLLATGLWEHSCGPHSDAPPFGSCACGCHSGWTGSLCDRCADGFGGAACTACASPCGRGVCLGDDVCACEDGWTGSSCDACAGGYAGSDCSACPAGADGSACGAHGSCNDGMAGDGGCACLSGWTGRSCDDVVVAPDVVFDLASAVFDGSGASLLLTFSGDAAPLLAGTAASSIVCAGVIADAAPLGSGCLASWLSSRQLRLQLGPDATLLPASNSSLACAAGRSVQPLRGALQDAALLKSAITCRNALPPDRTAPPDVVLLAPQLAPSCGNVTVDGSLSGGSSARLLDWRWSASPAPPAYAPVSDALLRLLQQATAQAAPSIVLTPTELPPGQAAVISLHISSFLAAEAGQAAVTIARSTLPLPALRLVGPALRRQLRNQPLRLAAELEEMASGDGSACGPPADVLTWRWQLLQGTVGTGADAGNYSVSAQELVLPAGTLALGEQLRWRVTATSLLDAALTNSDEVVVTVAGAGLLASIAGGDERQVGRRAALLLDGSASTDLDGTGEPLQFAWSCGEACFLALPSSAQLQLPRLALAAVPSPVTFTLTVTQLDRQATASVRLHLLDGEPPTVSIQSSPAAVNEQAALLLEGAVSSDDGDAQLQPLALCWSLTAGGLQLAEDAVASSLLALAAGALSGAPHFVFRLTATRADGQQAYAQVSISVNAAPRGGALAVAPGGAGNVLTRWRLSTAGWTDDAADLPLSFAFAAVAGSTDDSSRQLLLSSGRPAATLYSRLPLGGGTSRLVRVVAIVSDVWGATGRGSLLADGTPATVVVLPLADSAAGEAAVQALLPTVQGEGLPAVQALAQLALPLRDGCAAVACGQHGSCVAGRCVCDASWLGDACDQQASQNGAWTAWAPWTDCTVSCGGGSQTRSRSCSAPPPAFGGASCPGDDLQTRGCAPWQCAAKIDGGYSAWSPWAACSASCDGTAAGRFVGSRVRTRLCNSPTPTVDGRSCALLGSAQQTERCVTPLCAGPLLPCRADCSGHGSCQRTPAGCGAADVHCRAACECDAGWMGWDCSRPLSDGLASQQLTELLLDRLPPLDAVAGDSTPAARAAADALAMIVGGQLRLSTLAQFKALDRVEQLLEHAGDDTVAASLLTTVAAVLDSSVDLQARVRLLLTRLAAAATAGPPQPPRLLQGGSALQMAVGHAVNGSQLQLQADGVQLQMPAVANGAVALTVWRLRPYDVDLQRRRSAIVAVEVVGQPAAHWLPGDGQVARLTATVTGSAEALQCRWWDAEAEEEEEGRWSSEGVVTSRIQPNGDGTITISCDTTHFTDFAVFEAGDGGRDGARLQAETPFHQLWRRFDHVSWEAVAILGTVLLLSAAAARCAARTDKRDAPEVDRLRRTQMARFGRLGVPPPMSRVGRRLAYRLRAQHLWLALLTGPPAAELLLASRLQRVAVLAAVVLTQLAANAMFYRRGTGCTAMKLSSAVAAMATALPLHLLLPAAIAHVRQADSIVADRQRAAGFTGRAVVRKSLASVWAAIAEGRSRRPSRTAGRRSRRRGGWHRAELTGVEPLLALSSLLLLLLGTVILLGATSFYFNATWGRDALLPMTSDAVMLLGCAVVAAACLSWGRRPPMIAMLVASLLLWAAHTAYFVSSWLLPAPLVTAGFLRADWQSLAAEADRDSDLREELTQLQADLRCCGYDGPHDMAVGACSVDEQPLPGCAPLVPSLLASEVRALSIASGTTCILLALPAIAFVVRTCWLRRSRQAQVMAVEMRAARLASIKMAGVLHTPKKHRAAARIQAAWRGHNTRLGTRPMMELAIRDGSSLQSLRAVACWLALLLVQATAAYVAVVHAVKFDGSKALCWAAASAASVLLDAFLQQPLLLLWRAVLAELLGGVSSLLRRAFATLDVDDG